MDMYAEQILELYRDPENFGKMEGATHSGQLNNPLCGDEQTIYLKIDKNVIQDVSFEGEGCAISTASTSLLTEELKGMPIEEVKKIGKETILELLGVPVTSSRMKCALLGLNIVLEAVKNE